MSVKALGWDAAARGGRLAEELPAPSELAGALPVAPGADAAFVRLEPLAAPPRPTLWATRASPALDARSIALFESLGARARELTAPTHGRGAHDDTLRSAVRAVSGMVTTLCGLEALEREATLARGRAAVRA